METTTIDAIATELGVAPERAANLFTIVRGADGRVVQLSCTRCATPLVPQGPPGTESTWSAGKRDYVGLHARCHSEEPRSRTLAEADVMLPRRGASPAPEDCPLICARNTTHRCDRSGIHCDPHCVCACQPCRDLCEARDAKNAEMDDAERGTFDDIGNLGSR